MKACTTIFIEPNGVNAFIRRTPLPESPQDYKQVKSVAKQRVLSYIIKSLNAFQNAFQVYSWNIHELNVLLRGRRGRDLMVVGYITTYAISAYNHLSCKFDSHSGEVYLIQQYVKKFVSDLRRVGDFSTNTTDHHDITEILL
jgi:hypothetical protein